LKFYKGTCDLWILFCTREDPVSTSKNLESSDANFDKIEMSVGLLTDAVSPITVHMGILRSFLFFKRKSSPHKGISMYMHTFGGAFAKDYYTNKQYMYTRPATIMSKIIYKFFNDRHMLSNGEIYIASNDDREEYISSIYKKFFDKKSAPAIPPLHNQTLLIDTDKIPIDITNTNVIINGTNYNKTKFLSHQDLYPVSFLFSMFINIDILDNLWQTMT
jgi:hypothetical protein